MFVEDVEPYELMKLRLLNSSHSAMAYVSLLASHVYVDEALADDDSDEASPPRSGGGGGGGGAQSQPPVDDRQQRAMLLGIQGRSDGGGQSRV